MRKKHKNWTKSPKRKLKKTSSECSVIIDPLRSTTENENALGLEEPSAKLAKHDHDYVKKSTAPQNKQQECMLNRNEQRRNKPVQNIDLYCDKNLAEHYASFLSHIKVGADYICTCCERKLFASSMQLFVKNRYATETLKYVVHSIQSVRDKVWICEPCHNKLSVNEIPPQSTYNGLQLEDVPEELQNLNSLEKCLIAQRIGFKKIIRCKMGKQLKVVGQVVNIPTSVHKVCQILPRLPDSQEIYHAHLKRDSTYNAVYMKDYINVHQIMSALKYLKRNNKFYQTIDIREDFVSEVQNQQIPDAINKENVDINSIIIDIIQNRFTELREKIPDRLHNELTCLENILCKRKSIINLVHFDYDSIFSSVAHLINHPDVTSNILRKRVYDYLKRIPTESDNNIFMELIPSDGMFTNSIDNSTVQLFTVREKKNLHTYCENERMRIIWKNFVNFSRRNLPSNDLYVHVLSALYRIKFNITTFSGTYTISYHEDSTDTYSLVKLGANFYLPESLVSNTMRDDIDKMMNDLDKARLNDINEPMDIDESESSPNLSESRETNEPTIDEEREALNPVTSLQKPNIGFEDRTLLFAPGEGKKPISLLGDTYFEQEANPDKYPSGRGGFYGVSRPVNISMKQFIKQRLMHRDPRFRLDLDYVFTSQFAVEAEQLASNISIAVKQISGRKINGKLIDAKFISDPDNKELLIKHNLAHKVLSNVRGSSLYWDSVYRSVKSMLQQLACPTWFITLSSAETRWPELLKLLAKEKGQNLTDDQACNLDWQEKCKLIAEDPVTTSRYCNHRLQKFFSEVLQNEKNPIGEVEDYMYRIEFQARASNHAHGIIWIKDSVDYKKDSPETIADFVDKYQTCELPMNDDNFRLLVEKRMVHVHGDCCKKDNIACRFYFPKFPLKRTIIRRNKIQDKTTTKSEYDELCSRFKKGLKGTRDMTIDEFVESLGYDYDSYERLIIEHHPEKGPLLRRKVCEVWINCYNPTLLKLWRANMDIQFILDPYACLKYITSYMLKPERKISKMIKTIIKESGKHSTLKTARDLTSAYCLNREVGAQEATYRALSIPLKMSTRQTVYIDNKLKGERCGFLKDDESIRYLPEDTQDIVCSNLLDYYPKRIAALEDQTLADIAANYKYVGTYGTTPRFEPRIKSAIIRYYKPHADENPVQYMQSLLLLFVPWRNENKFNCSIDQLNTLFKLHQETIIQNQRKYQKLDDSILEELQTKIDAQISKESIANEEVEIINDHIDTVIPELKPERTTNKYSTKNKVFLNVVPKHRIGQEKYLENYLLLNKKQKLLVDKCRNWCLQYVENTKNGIQSQPFFHCITGSAGVGKSFCLNMIVEDFYKYIPLGGTVDRDASIVLITSFTGSAAFNVHGQTIHSALSIPPKKKIYEQLTSERFDDLFRKYGDIKLLIIDEISLVTPLLLMFVNKRLQEIKKTGEGVPFGGVNIIVTGDFYQLQPIERHFCFQYNRTAVQNTNDDVWWPNFDRYELTEIVRQKDKTFANLLERVRFGLQTDRDIQLLQTRDSMLHQYEPEKILHVFARRKQVIKHNENMMELMKLQGHNIISVLAKKYDSNDSNSGSITSLDICEGCPIIITINIDVPEGIANGTRGIVKKIIFNEQGKVTAILIRFLDPEVGLSYKSNHLWKKDFPDCVPIYKKFYRDYTLRANHPSLQTQEHFPITLGYATTIHKVQGLTMENILVDFSLPHEPGTPKNFLPGQAYVALSRVKKLENLYIKDFSEDRIVANLDGANELQLLPTIKLDLIEQSNSFVSLNVRSLRGSINHLCNFFTNTPNLRVKLAALQECNIANASIVPRSIGESLHVICGNKIKGVHHNVLLIDATAVLTAQLLGGLSTVGQSYYDLFRVIDNGEQVYHILVLYRLHNEDTSLFVQSMRNIMQFLSKLDTPILISGDMNLRLNQLAFKEVCEMLEFLKFTHVYTESTTIFGTRIDHLFTRSINNDMAITVPVSFSDHKAIVYEI